MASRQELLNSIRPGMKLTKGFFIKVLAYDMTTPGFANDALARIKILGCSNAEKYYTCIVAEWRHEHDRMIKRVSAWYNQQDFDRKKVRGARKQQEAELQRRNLLIRKKHLLTQKSRQLTMN